MHTPVLIKEVLDIFDPKPGETYIDATVNGGGHARAILEKMDGTGTVVGIDWDCVLIEKLQEKNIANLKLICENYGQIEFISKKHNLGKVNGILFDLGFSSYHLTESGRGFSFLSREPLDMRYHTDSYGINAAQIVNTWTEKAIEDLLREFGEERFSLRIAKGIIAARTRKKITQASELAEIVCRSFPGGRMNRRIHSATRTFQALRIAVNNELENISQGLEGAVRILKPGGKIIVISFHSLEDRIVKNFLKANAASGLIKILTPKPIRAGSKEINQNPRARSAKLRAGVMASSNNL